jgi:hypothetical protein
MKEVVRARFSGEKRAAVPPFEETGAQNGREVSPIPGEPFVVVEIEKVDFFSEGRGNKGMLGKIVVEGCGSAALRADDDIIRQLSHPGCKTSELSKSIFFQMGPFFTGSELSF